MSDFGLYGLAVMGQNFALNVAEHGFKISVANRSPAKVDECVRRAQEELGDQVDNLVGYKSNEKFVASLAKPRKVMFLVKAGSPVDSCVDMFKDLLEPGDVLIDGGNEWYLNSERRAKLLEPYNILYMAMGVSGGEEGARKGPSIMPGGPRAGFDLIEPIITACAAQADSGACTTYVGKGASGNYVKMVHNGIEYGDMQLIAEAMVLLRDVGGMSIDEVADVFAEWNKGRLQSFLIEITALILKKDDDDVYAAGTRDKLAAGKSKLIERVLDKTGNKGTGKMTAKEGADRAVPLGTMSSALDARFIAADKDRRTAMGPLLEGVVEKPQIEPAQLIADVEQALYCSKIMSYSQGMNLIRQASNEDGWGVDLGECARIWKGGCIIRAQFLDRIKAAYDHDADLPSLLVDPDFTAEINAGQAAWRRVVGMCAMSGIPAPSMYGSLAYFDSYRQSYLETASLVQAQRDFFGSHTFERDDKPRGEWFHCKWTDAHAI